MAGQGIERREVLRVMALAAGAARFPGFQRWAFACDHVSATGVQVKPAQYTPQFFTPAEYTTVERLAEMIIPSDGPNGGAPGASEAGVSEFIDFMVSSDPSVQYRFRYGLTWLDAHAEKLHGKTFRQLSAEQQNDLLEDLAYKDHHRPGEEDGREFFKLVREYTVMGFYTSRIGLQQLDFPGLKLYSESPGCPHLNDPEHRHLPQAQS
jgi:gluconate 2-dehydrogenase gamma chain